MQCSLVTRAWLVFLGLLLLELILEYVLRLNSNTPYQLSLPEPLWFAWQIAAAALGGYFLVRSAARFASTGRKVLHLLGHAALGLVVYLLILYAYVLGQGIDSF